jgi:hypothetical protein
LAYLATTVNDVTGNSTSYILGTGTALTEVFDQNSNFNGSAFIAPVTGIYIFTSTTAVTGMTIAANVLVQFNSSNRTYRNSYNRNASSLNMTPRLQALCDMDAGDSVVAFVTVGGEAADTADVSGSANAFTHFSGCLIG